MFFETIYRWFASFFGGDMADYLSGYICPSEDSEGGYLGTNQFISFGFIALGTALLITIIYYYVINNSRFNQIWSWLLMVLLVALSNFGIAVGILWNQWYNDGTAECLINGSNGGIDSSNCLGFGFAHSIISILFFILFSISLKWWSTNCKRTPF